MKKSIYINKENEIGLKNLQADKNKSVSSIINKALADYIQKYNFDTSELRCKKEYRTVSFRLHKEVVRLLCQLKHNFNAKAVNELVMWLLVREFIQQKGRMKFPDRLYCGLEHINKQIDRLKKLADVRKVSEIE